MSVPIQPTQFTRESARRIASVVRASELTPLPARPLEFERADVFKAKVFRVGTFTGPWPIGTENTVTFKNVTNTPNTVTVQNLFFPVDFSPSGEPDCGIAKEGTSWFLISLPLETAEAVVGAGTKEEQVLATAQTAKITFFGTNATSQIEFFSGVTADLTFIAEVIKTTQEITLLTSVSASLNTTNCTIAITPQTENITVVTDAYGTEETQAVLLPGNAQTAISVSMSSTQTAVVLANILPKTISLLDGTYTGTFLRLGIY